MQENGLFSRKNGVCSGRFWCLLSGYYTDFTLKQLLPGSKKAQTTPNNLFLIFIVSLTELFMRQLQELPSQVLLIF